MRRFLVVGCLVLTFSQTFSSREMSSVSSRSAATLVACARRASTAFFAWAEEKDEGSGWGAARTAAADDFEAEDEGAMSDRVFLRCLQNPHATEAMKMEIECV